VCLHFEMWLEKLFSYSLKRNVFSETLFMSKCISPYKYNSQNLIPDSYILMFLLHKKHTEFHILDRNGSMLFWVILLHFT
jgi:hypothetical protein